MHAREGVILPVSTLTGWFGQAGAALSPLADALRRDLPTGYQGWSNLALFVQMKQDLYLCGLLKKYLNNIDIESFHRRLYGSRLACLDGKLLSICCHGLINKWLTI